MLKRHPKEDRKERQDPDNDQPISHNIGWYFSSGLFVGVLICFDSTLPDLTEQRLAKIKHDHSQAHEDPCKTKSKSPSNFFAHVTTEENSKKRAGIDTHVENGVSPVFFLGTVCIELANQRGNVRFEKTVTNDQQ